MKILCVDDHWVSRTGLRHLLSRLPRPVNAFLEAGSFKEAREIATQHTGLDLILLDLLMPDGSGFEEIAALAKIVPEVPIIIVSMAESREDVVRALDAGAMGFAPKSAPGDIVLNAIEAVLRGEIYVPQNIFGAPSRPTPTPPQLRRRTKRIINNAAAAARIPSLTRRQKQVFQLLGAGNSNAAIAKLLGISEHTVAIHVSAILKTLNVENRTQAALIIAAS